MPPSSLPRIKIPHIDKAAHFGFFFVQSVLISLLLRFRTKRSFLQIIFLATLQAFVYGGVIEILQNHFFNRTGDLYDLIADMLGGLCGALAYPVFLRLFNVRFKKYI
jgi:VanZ family protein